MNILFFQGGSNGSYGCLQEALDIEASDANVKSVQCQDAETTLCFRSQTIANIEVEPEGDATLYLDDGSFYITLTAADIIKLRAAFCS